MGDRAAEWLITVSSYNLVTKNVGLNYEVDDADREVKSNRKHALPIIRDDNLLSKHGIRT